MFRERPRLYLDFVDPGSFVMWRRLSEAGIPFDPVGFELRPPGEPMVDASDRAWRAYWEEQEEPLRTLGIVAARPATVPRTRKAHELVLAAAGDGVADTLLERLFEAYVVDATDIGRIDVLVALAEAAGLDRTATRAALDVDRWTGDVVERRLEAAKAGVRGVPTLRAGSRRLEGVHESETIHAFLGSDRSPEAPDPS